MRRLNDLIERLFLVVGASLFAVFVAVIFFQVMARNYIKISVVWTDEVALICFVWSVFLGAAVALRRRAHYVVEVLPSRFLRVNNGLKLFADLATLAVIYVLIVAGWTYVGMGMRRFSVSTGVPLAYVFAAIPVSGAAMLCFSVELLLQDLKDWRRGRPEEAPADAPSDGGGWIT